MTIVSPQQLEAQINSHHHHQCQLVSLRPAASPSVKQCFTQICIQHFPQNVSLVLSSTALPKNQLMHTPLPIKHLSRSLLNSSAPNSTHIIISAKGLCDLLLRHLFGGDPGLQQWLSHCDRDHIPGVVTSCHPNGKLTHLRKGNKKLNLKSHS